MSIEEQICEAIVAAIKNAKVEVSGNGGHFSLRVESVMFDGKKTLEKQRMVYSALKELMAGNNMRPFMQSTTLRLLFLTVDVKPLLRSLNFRLLRNFSFNDLIPNSILRFFLEGNLS